MENIEDRKNGVILVCEDVTEDNYILLNNLYKRNIGSLDYFIWKNIKEKKYNISSEIKAFSLKRNDTYLSIVIARKCEFSLKHRQVSINMLSDFGIDECVKSRTLIIESAKQTHRNDVDATVCYSDERKIKCYSKIFEKYICDRVNVFDFTEIIVEGATKIDVDLSDFNEIDNISKINFFGREVNRDWIAYSKQCPCYKYIKLLTVGKELAILGFDDTTVEVIGLSNTSPRTIISIINACFAIRTKCRIILPNPIYSELQSRLSKHNIINKFSMMIAWHTEEDFNLCHEDIFINKIDKR
ncbi:hypothetical protein BB987_13855 [Photorhabdus temperata]|uniref:Uncharacterized protein n=1 Tax=Photorhabdus khanii NC19 TaxID=1004151 RepID=W3V6E2_9GAMM|nr:hypothetical protein [Photorhabdus khanii]ETS31417.1 hypothetical protein PTE_02102 [Photorhabdus khanii NC19]OHV52630.1 hypothetical protein BB987_13855 [Photorhabdus temperata]